MDGPVTWRQLVYVTLGCYWIYLAFKRPAEAPDGA